MSKFVLALDRVRPADFPLIGAKAVNLSRLAKAGFPVPPGQCITTETFSLALGERRQVIANILNDAGWPNMEHLQNVAAKIAITLKGLRVPPAILNALVPLISTYGLLAVRSSSTAEDQISHSYAGIYMTTLGVQSLDALESAVVACWCSFYAPAALAARARAGAAEQEHGMAVLIQPLIKAECAGVCFTVDPVARRHDVMVINAAWGLGSGIVDGRVAGDTYWVHRRHFEVERCAIPEKVWQVTPDGGSQLAEVPLERRQSACLPAAWLQRLAQFALSIETMFGTPQDIEWAVSDHRLWILQSRPLTAIIPDLAAVRRFPAPHTGDHFWSIMDDYGRDPGPLLPLEQDALMVAESIREDACRFIGADRNQAVRFFNGRPYRHPLPLDLSQADRHIRRQVFVDLHERLHAQNLSSWDYWGPEIVTATERLNTFDISTANGIALADHLENVLATRRRHLMIHPLCSFNPPSSYFQALHDITGNTDVQLLAYQLIDSGETPLTAIIEALESMAQAVPESARSMIQSAPDDILDQLAILPEAAHFLSLLNDFLARYGERTGDGWGSEAALTYPTWRERPQDVCRVLKVYLEPELDSPAAARTRTKAERELLVEDLCRRCSDPSMVAHFRMELAYAGKVVATLEFHNHYIDQLSTGQMRRAVMAAAHWLAGQKILRQAGDIFYLSFDEIAEALRTPIAISFKRQIARRRQQHQRWASFEAPPIVGIPNPLLPERPPWQDDTTQSSHLSRNGLLTGQGASPGRQQGRARVLVDENAFLAKGDILVARNIGPRWAPSLPILAAIVLDGGAIGQHAAAAAREYGIPAVIATRWATERIVDGAQIIVDGTHGTVEFAE